MSIRLTVPDARSLSEIDEVMRTWQQPGLPVQLHPGDVGWAAADHPEGPERLLRVWRDEGAVVAVGYLDSPDLVRMAVDPDRAGDARLVAALRDDLDDPAAGVLPAGGVAAEIRGSARLREAMRGAGWVEDEPWAVLERDLAVPVTVDQGRVEVVGPERGGVFAAAHRAAWQSERLTEERWAAVTRSSAFIWARSLVLRDERAVTVGAAAVWSAGEGRPGIVEPLGVDPAHRGRGWGVALVQAAAHQLQQMGASSAHVSTPVANAVAVGAYQAGGFELVEQTRDIRRRAGA